MQSFKNEAFTDYNKTQNRSAMQSSLKKLAAEFGKVYPLIIDGERVATNEFIESRNPAHMDQLLARFHGASTELAKRAVEVAAKTFAMWKNVAAEVRSEFLFKAANLMRERKHDFSAVLVYEVGKSWPEADGDTAEAIDFLEFYARENLRYAKPQPLTPIAGEHNELNYIPLGVCVVIPPWNFPLAIMAGMTAAAFVAGNTVVLKPSSDAPLTAMKFFELLEEVGLPKGVVNFLPGRGGKVGDALVAHPKTRLVAFTGSKAVGLHINELAAKTQPGQIWIKRVIAEMGGKDAIIVDSDCDLAAAVDGVWRSAFGFQGQKCSACSRAIVVSSVYEAFINKLKSRVAEIKVGDPTNPECYMGPVINEKAYQSILDYIRVGEKEGRIVCGGKAIGSGGYFIEPTVVADIAANARLAQEEIFGPVLAIIKANDFAEAMSIANNTDYGLTGAVYTSDEKKLAQAARDFHVGNLYLNRKCTGALVGAHPFGGFNMSGTDSKAGGSDYLLLFLQAKVCSRKL